MENNATGKNIKKQLINSNVKNNIVIPSTIEYLPVPADIPYDLKEVCYPLIIFPVRKLKYNDRIRYV